MIESKNIKIIIAYDGANYSGWQKQKNKKTIQGIIEEKIRIIAGDKSIKLHGSGRTDAGVHAIGQVANFNTSSDLPVDKWLPVLNNELPENIRIMSARQVAEKFHARYSAISKLYKYYVMTGNSIDKNYNYSLRYVFLKNYCYFLNKELDVDRMNKTAKYLVGYHDFTSLSCLNKKKSQRKENRTRKVISLNITKKKKLVCFSIEANAFLYKMVRIIVGTLIDFSVNEREPEEIIKLIELKSNLKSGKVVPANGLYLMKVRYK